MTNIFLLQSLIAANAFNVRLAQANLITKTPFSPSASTSLLHLTAGPIPCTLPSLTPHTNFSNPTPIFPQSFT